jgi:hypothetical protein
VAEPKHTVSIMAYARGETACITEWLLYHQTIGFDHVYLYCNDEDPTDLYTQVLPFCRGDEPFVTFHHFPFPGQQFYMMMHALRHHKDASHWVAFLDVDEFLVLHGFDGIQDYLRRCPANWDSISFNRSVFGNSGYIERPPSSVLTTYTRRENRLHPASKTVTRTAKIDLSRITGTLYFWHGWSGAFGPGFLAVNAAGVPMAEVAGSDDGAAYVGSAEAEGRIRRIGYVNHYAFKSTRDFERHLQRGMLGDFHTQLMWQHVADAPGAEATLQALNAVEDTYLADFWRHRLRLDQAQQIVPLPQLPNIALGKRADQSSISEWSRGATTADDAAGAINGLITGGAQCHTSLETDPWWMVDFGGPHLIYEIRIFNRVDHPSVRERLGSFRVERADADSLWAQIYTHDGSAHDGSRLVGGADGSPLILRLASPLSAVRLRLVALGHTYLHLDQVEIYGVPVTDTAPRDAAGLGRASVAANDPVDAVSGSDRTLGSDTAANDDAPVVHVEGRGGVANRMIQYMAAYAIAANVSGCRVSGVDLPDWGIHHPEIPRGAGIREACASGPEMRIGRAALIASLVSRRVNRMRLDSLAQHLDNFPPREVCAGLFRAVVPDVPVFGADHLIVQLPGVARIEEADPDHTLLPVEFYQEIVVQSGLRPVFIGEPDDNADAGGAYIGRLRAAFPRAVFLPRQRPLHDFETIRRAPNILLGVSTFGWLAAWLSQAERIYLPMTGFLNPAQFPEIDLLPLDDPRYRFYLFPANYAVPEAEIAAAHASLRGQWRLMTPSMITELRARRPRFGSPLELFQEHFDEAFYLGQHEAVRAAVAAGRLQSGFEHFRDYGYFARLAPFRLDRAWYGREYKLAAIEVGQGDFADFHHHYLAIGQMRGYLPFPVG